jgi:endonuclease/exonuclease/phosphatase family metal-dependent hydrolase
MKRALSPEGSEERPAQRPCADPLAADLDALAAMGFDLADPAARACALAALAEGSSSDSDSRAALGRAVECLLARAPAVAGVAGGAAQALSPSPPPGTAAVAEETREAAHPCLSFNVSGLAPAATAPPGWTPAHSLAAILRLMAEASVVALQEAPPALGAMLPRDLYYISELVPSHCGMCAVVLRRSAWEDVIACPLPRVPGAVAVTARCRVSKRRVALVSMHNAPFNDAGAIADRLARTAQLAKVLSVLGLAAIVMGDFNMRKAENASVTRLGFVDAFEAAGSPRHAEFTWDSKANPYHAGGFGFTVRTSRHLCSSFSLQ